MSNINPDVLCGNCVHFLRTEAQCRKYAPRGEGRPWPSVQAKDWCSEFEKTKDAVPASDLPNQNAKKPNSLEDVSSGKEIIE
ncbi:MAG: hypothetical protein ISS76_17475 [Phycisphaerae bacterium]|nr:hypothetical protein [Phycisphaerae bacterium]